MSKTKLRDFKLNLADRFPTDFNLKLSIFSKSHFQFNIWNLIAQHFYLTSRTKKKKKTKKKK